MAITFFGVATSPADNSNTTGPTVTLTPPASMVDGDLVFVSVRYRDSAATISATPSDAAGQTWNAVAQYNTTNIRARVFWCRFNGTWSGSGTPAFTVTSGTNNIDAQMLVFRPTSAAYTWTLESGPNSATYAAPSTPFTVNITGRTTTANSTVSIALWHSVDDNSWGTLSGTGWSKTSLTAQYRNNGTNDNSSTYAYNIKTAAGATNDVSQQQTALGGDAGSTALFTFAETLVSTAPTGVSSTVSAGSLAIANTFAGVAGVESAVAAGTATVPGSGTNATGSPVGVSATFSAGTLVVSPISSAVTPVGAGMAVFAGTTIEPISAVPVGVSAAVSAGTPSGIGASAGVVPIGGVEAFPAAGVLNKASPVVGLAGTGVAVQLGVLAAGGAGIIHATGQTPGILMTIAVGTVVVPVAEPIPGVVSIVTAESLGDSSLVAEIDGVAAVATAGALLAPVSTVMPWVSATALAGALQGLTASSAIPSGVSAAAVVGTAAGVPSGSAVQVPQNVVAQAQVGTLQANWDTQVPLSGVAATAEAGTATVQGGDSVSDEVFPSGVVGTMEVGTITVNQATLSILSVVISCEVGTLRVVLPGSFPPPKGRIQHGREPRRELRVTRPKREL